MNRGVDRAPIVRDDRDRVEFGTSLGDAHERLGVRVHAYCLMPNHYHLLVRDPGDRISEFMHHFGTTFTRRLNDRWRRDGPLFRGRFHSVPIRSETQLLRCFRYIHRNPIAIVGVEHLDRYRWSSHRTYLGERRAPSWLDTTALSRCFPSIDGYRRFIAPSATTDDAVVDIPVGDLDHLVHAVAIELDELRPGPGLTRAVALALDQRHEGVTTLVHGIEFASANALRSATSRARRRLAGQPEFGELIRRVEHALQLGSDPE